MSMLSIFLLFLTCCSYNTCSIMMVRNAYESVNACGTMLPVFDSDGQRYKYIFILDLDGTLIPSYGLATGLYVRLEEDSER